MITSTSEDDMLLDSPALVLNRQFMDSAQASALLHVLDETLDWKRPSLHVYGRRHPIPRQQVWMGDEATRYRYSGQTFIAEPWHPTVALLARRIERHLADNLVPFRCNSVLINRYADGSERMGWHRDNEPELGSNPLIAAISLGAERPLRFRWRDRHAPSFNVWLLHGSLLIMGPGVQSRLEHALLPRKSSGLRINLTFRYIYSNEQKTA